MREKIASMTVLGKNVSRIQTVPALPPSQIHPLLGPLAPLLSSFFTSDSAYRSGETLPAWLYRCPANASRTAFG